MGLQWLCTSLMAACTSTIFATAGCLDCLAGVCASTQRAEPQVFLPQLATCRWGYGQAQRQVAPQLFLLQLAMDELAVGVHKHTNILRLNRYCNG